MARNLDKLFESIYENPEHPDSFSSPYRLFRAAKLRNKKVKLSDVEDWLSGQDAYTLHRRVKDTFVRRPVLVRGPFHQYQADLVDYQPISKENSGHRYVLTAIDCFSRLAAAVPIKSKHASVMVPALKKAFTNLKSFPKKLQTDKGTEFYNSEVKSFLRKNNIGHFSTDQELKAQIVERFNRTLREKLQRYMVANNTLRYVKVMPSFIRGYNNSPHSCFDRKYSPAQVNARNYKQLHQIMYGDYLAKKAKRHKFRIGDKIRIASYRKLFRKTRDSTFTRNTFEIVDLLNTNPPTYRIKDLKDGELIDGAFYEEQMQRVK